MNGETTKIFEEESQKIKEETKKIKERQAVEQKIFKKLIEINEIYKEYNPEGNYLSMTVINGIAMAYDLPPESSDKERINIFEYVEEPVEGQG